MFKRARYNAFSDDADDKERSDDEEEEEGDDTFKDPSLIKNQKCVVVSLWQAAACGSLQLIQI